MQTVVTLDQLAQIKTGQEFVLRGLIHRAREDAVDGVNRFTQDRKVTVAGERRNPAMPSGWELCDLLEYDTTIGLG